MLEIPLTKGRLPEASREVERVRCSRADLQSAPGRPWEDARPPGMARAARKRGGWFCVCRRSASPSFLREEKSKWRVDSEADFPNSHLAMDKTPTRIAL
jgi:hypothetical protein